MKAAIQAVVKALEDYLRAQIQNAAIVIGLYIAGFAIVGVPWWGVAGLLCGLLQLIPHLGSVLSLAIALLLKGLAGGTWLQLLAVFATWLLIQMVDAFLLAPRAAGRAGIRPLPAILITLAAGLWLGPLGVIFAIPAVAIVLIIVRTVWHKSL